jgi:hypothetical protein
VQRTASLTRLLVRFGELDRDTFAEQLAFAVEVVEGHRSVVVGFVEGLETLRERVDRRAVVDSCLS